MRFYDLGISRRYGVHVPRRVVRQPALVVAIHGGGLGSPQQHERMTGWSALADKDRGFVVVYPEGLKATWNAGNGALGYAGRAGVDDVGFLSSMLLDVARRYAIDDQRVYLSGHSNGSMMAHRYAAEDPGLVAAIAGVSGGFSAIPTDGCPNPPAVRIVHGYEDTHVPFAGGVGPKALDPYEHVAIGRTEAWWRAQGGDVVTRYGAWSHQWPEGETAAQWAWFKGRAL